MFGHLKGSRSFRRFSLRGLNKVHVEFGIVALAHNLLKVAGIRLTTFRENRQTKKWTENITVFRPFILGTYWTAPCFFLQPIEHIKISGPPLTPAKHHLNKLRSESALCGVISNGLVSYSLSFVSLNAVSRRRSKLSTIATTVAKAMPFNSKLPHENVVPLIPITRTTVVKIILVGFA